MYAVVETSGRQYKVSVGDTVTVDRVDAEVGASLSFDRILLLGGDSVVVGSPVVPGVTVTATVVEHMLGDKQITRKYRRRQRRRRRVGFRASLTRIQILSINKEA
jgi:large subunit ribosomal protein L21